jgi:hypothetical protein
MSLAETWACVTNPIGCATGAASSWFSALPLEWVVGGALVAGLLVGAWLGRLAVAVLLAVGAALIFWRRSPADDSENVPADSPDAHVPPRRRRQPTQPRRKTLWDIIEESQKQ